MKVAFIGPYDLIFPFKSLGAEIINSENRDVSEIKKEIEESEFAVVYVFEDVFRELEEFQELVSRPDINIVPIPGIEGSQGYGKKRIRELVKKAVGMDIGGFE